MRAYYQTGPRVPRPEPFERHYACDWMREPKPGELEYLSSGWFRGLAKKSPRTAGTDRGQYVASGE